MSESETVTPQPPDDGQPSPLTADRLEAIAGGHTIPGAYSILQGGIGYLVVDSDGYVVYSATTYADARAWWDARWGETVWQG